MPFALLLSRYSTNTDFVFVIIFQQNVHSLTAGVNSPHGQQLVGKLAFGQDCMQLCSSVVS